MSSWTFKSNTDRTDFFDENGKKLFQIKGKTMSKTRSNLISAAPDLLSESKRLLEVLYQHYPNAANTIAAASLEEAIDKAEGKKVNE